MWIKCMITYKRPSVSLVLMLTIVHMILITLTLYRHRMLSMGTHEVFGLKSPVL